MLQWQLKLNEFDTTEGQETLGVMTTGDYLNYPAVFFITRKKPGKLL